LLLSRPITPVRPAATENEKKTRIKEGSEGS
jgi:hypothetical protein